MGKTKIEIIRELTAGFVLLDPRLFMEIKKQLKQAYDSGHKVGFESFRVKAEEGVNKISPYYLNTASSGRVDTLAKSEVLTTINDIKE